MSQKGKRQNVRGNLCGARKRTPPYIAGRKRVKYQIARWMACVLSGMLLINGNQKGGMFHLFENKKIARIEKKEFQESNISNFCKVKSRRCKKI